MQFFILSWAEAGYGAIGGVPQLADILSSE
jgi:hypothetical protein